MSSSLADQSECAGSNLKSTDGAAARDASRSDSEQPCEPGNAASFADSSQREALNKRLRRDHELQCEPVKIESDERTSFGDPSSTAVEEELIPTYANHPFVARQSGSFAPLHDADNDSADASQSASAKNVDFVGISSQLLKDFDTYILESNSYFRRNVEYYSSIKKQTYSENEFLRLLASYL